MRADYFSNRKDPKLLLLGTKQKMTHRLSLEIQKQSTGGILRKDALKICSRFTEEHQRRSVISIKLLCNFALRHGSSPVRLLHIFRTTFPRNTSGWLPLEIA